MPAKSTTFDNDLLKQIYNATPIANLADNAATAPLTNLYLALHTADPTVAGTQASSEATYTGYARAAVARSSAGFTVSGASVTLAAAVNFAPCTAGSNTITHFSVGVAASGATKILHYGTVSPNLTIANGSTPQLGTGTTITES